MGRHVARFSPFSRIHERLLLVLLGVVVAVSSACGAITPGDAAPMGGADGEPCPGTVTQADPVELEPGVVQQYADEGADHVLCDVGYGEAPPASGPHFPVWQNCGFYTAPVRDETAVHSIEHGAIWIAFDPNLPAAEVDAIEALVGTSAHYLASPYPGLLNPIVLTAWQRQVAVDHIDDPAVAAFAATQLGRISETAPEAGVSCESELGSAPADPDANYDQFYAQLAG